MPHLTFLLLLGGFLVGAPTVPAQQPAVQDTLSVPVRPYRPPSSTSVPTRRCRDATDRQAASPAVAQARCSGSFGAPAVPSGRRADLVGAQLRARMNAAIAAALHDPQPVRD